jgi:hypothetical protein
MSAVPIIGLRARLEMHHWSGPHTTTRYGWSRLCFANSFPLQKHEGQMSTPSSGSQTACAHLILTEWVRSQRQLSHSIWSPGSVTADDIAIQRGNKREQTRATLYFFGWLRLSLPVSDGHWVSPEKEGDRNPDLVSHLACADRPEEKGKTRRILVRKLRVKN